MIASLVAHADFAPVPRVEIRLQEVGTLNGGTPATTGPVLSGGGAASTGDAISGGSAAQTTVVVPETADAFTLWRVDDDRRRKVQGVVGRPYVGEASALDFAAPPNATSSYEVEFTAQGTTVAIASLGSTFLPWTGPEKHVLIQNPLNPSLNALVKNMAGSWPEITRTAPGEDVQLEDDDLPVFVGAGPLSGIDALSVDFQVPDRESAQRVWATLGTKERRQVPVWIVRSPNPGLMPKVFYGRVSSLQEIDRTVGRSRGLGGGGSSRFRAALIETRQPTPGIIAPLLRYTDLAAAFGGEYTGIAEALPRYSDWASAWEYSGAAG